ncbi:Response regulator receiver domain-containing protein [Hydrobacter penzbergensis]|uniref:Response regulator receiver domain-containing protein n=2 Tax=Hydrobacter penzbergensis TaxID=1235997 RepID=A0A8X8LCX6_9BACT|nr:Response regulator receiver domain-containing protein [Hydrobacter penzbergensis]
MTVNILIADDDEVMLQIIRSVLSRGKGFQLFIARNGKEAIQIKEKNKIDLVITDLMMPYANGFEVISAFRRDPETAGVPVVIVSSIGNEEAVIEGFKLGADDFIQKPIQVGEFMSRINRLLAKSSTNLP